MHIQTFGLITVF